jgi:hypothetical protein
MSHAPEPLQRALNPVPWCRKESSARRFDRGPKRSYLQTPGKEQYDQDKENDSTDSHSTTRPKGVITAATAKQQKQDQDQ